tara:strand:- start:670 stop:1836 length:1167 start_codon:yes stop_codon:yes gene_type:complete
VNLAELIIEVSKNAILTQMEDGSMPPGHNGPYNDNETPVRNTSHWLITFAKSYELTNNSIFLDAVQKAANYLISNEARPFNFSFYHRKKSQLDSCNGLIGQAWTMEALAIASIILNNKKYSELGEEVFLQHNFNNNYGLWNRLEIDGQIKSIDPTFNHQLWFAACGAQLKGSRKDKCDSIIKSFISKLPKNLSIIKGGLIFHPIKTQGIIKEKYDKKPIAILIRTVISKSINMIRNIIKQKEKQKNKIDKMIYKSIGYHHFNMYAFALLKDVYPNLDYWDREDFLSTIHFLLNDDYKKKIETNSFGYPYNPPGFEVPFALEKLAKLDNNELEILSKYWINNQLNRSYNINNKTMDKNTNDALTHSARIYELTRINNLNLKISYESEKN